MTEGGERESVRERRRECFRTTNTLQAVKAAQITGLIDYWTHSSWQVHPPLHPSIHHPSIRGSRGVASS